MQHNEIALQLVLNSSTSTNTGDNVLFDDIVFTVGNISYNPTTGIITYHQSGGFIIDCWLTPQSFQSTNGTTFAPLSSPEYFLRYNSLSRTGEVYRIGIIEISSAPITLSLIISTETAFYSPLVPLTDSLAIVQENKPLVIYIITKLLIYFFI